MAWERKYNCPTTLVPKPNARASHKSGNETTARRAQRGRGHASEVKAEQRNGDWTEGEARQGAV